MKLTQKTYHTLLNTNLTGSKIKDFLKCKQYFAQLHIMHTIEKPHKDVWDLGSAVDAWLTRGKKAFLSEYIAVARRSKEKTPGITELTMKMYNDAVDMCETMEDQPAYKALASHDAQVIIQTDMEIGKHFTGLSFMLDWLKIEGDTAIITDLKTSAETDARRWSYKCEDFGYYMQFAVATVIIRKNNPEVKKFVYRHLVIDKTEDVKTPYTFIIDNERVEMAVKYLLDTVIPAISNETEFSPKMVTWEEAEVVGEINQDY